MPGACLLQQPVAHFPDGAHIAQRLAHESLPAVRQAGKPGASSGDELSGLVKQKIGRAALGPLADQVFPGMLVY